jgi:hypothetical protein
VIRFFLRYPFLTSCPGNDGILGGGGGGGEGRLKENGKFLRIPTPLRLLHAYCHDLDKTSMLTRSQNVGRTTSRSLNVTISFMLVYLRAVNRNSKCRDRIGPPRRSVCSVCNCSNLRLCEIRVCWLRPAVNFQIKTVYDLRPGLFRVRLLVAYRCQFSDKDSVWFASRAV